MIEDAVRVGELAYLGDEFTGAMIGMRIQREANSEQLRAYRRAVEAWEITYSPYIQAWAERGPAWDEHGTRNLFAEVARSFAAFDELFGASEAAVLAQATPDEV